ncbi:unnamed protein product [Polarella glacialis]|uniref:Uncharacterized protein n=1 Tax=Polarella glacialis TaxID=89957 RepID=A0A813FII9_POLGL|nr:unnamed protein product [Polarella glacialis]
MSLTPSLCSCFDIDGLVPDVVPEVVPEVWCQHVVPEVVPGVVPEEYLMVPANWPNVVPLGAMPSGCDGAWRSFVRDPSVITLAKAVAAVNSARVSTGGDKKRKREFALACFAVSRRADRQHRGRKGWVSGVLVEHCSPTWRNSSNPITWYCTNFKEESDLMIALADRLAEKETLVYHDLVAVLGERPFGLKDGFREFVTAGAANFATREAEDKEAKAKKVTDDAAAAAAAAAKPEEVATPQAAAV